MRREGGEREIERERERERGREGKEVDEVEREGACFCSLSLLGLFVIERK